MKALAVVLWVLAWCCAGFIPASFFAARKGDMAMAQVELAAGTFGTAALALAGWALW